MRSRGITGVALAVATAAVLAACGGSTPEDGATSGATAGDSEMTVLRVGETAGAPSAFLLFGEHEGIFADHGLELEIDTSAGGAAAIPALVGGNLDVAGSNVVSALLSVSRGLPIRMIAPGTFATEDPALDYSAVLVTEDSDIVDADGLAGVQIAVNTLENIGDITITASLEERGVDASGIQFVELGFPDMLPALESGQVDAIWIIEPFLTMGLQQGHRALLWPYAEAREGLQTGSFLMTDEFLEANPEVVDNFRAAVAATAAVIAEDPDVFREVLPELQEFDPAIAQEMVLPRWSDAIDVGSLEFIADRMLQEGVVEEPIDVDAAIAQ